ncbi:MAG: sigma-54-dependent transcriptional regulator [bacterium]
MAEHSVYVIDDDPSIRELFTEALGEEYELKTFEDGVSGTEAIDEDPPDVLILDLRLPGKGGLEILEEVCDKHEDVQVVMVTAHQDVESAVRAMKLGAFDYVVKPFNIDEINIVIEKTIENKQLEEEVEDLRSHMDGQHVYTPLIGDSEAIETVRKRVHKVASTDSNVVVRGESGSGKEVVANMLHRESNRADDPFIAVNCAAVPAKLLESELFGYEKGAFTGAESDKTGKIEMAHNGSLFLDEIAAMPLKMQSKLLRVIETKRLTPVGAEEERAIDFRLISATSADIEQRIEQSEFREDLYYRINVVTIDLPPLREHKSDIPDLVDYFLEEIDRKMERSVSGVSSDAMELLMEHDWPGNVRELRNALESAAVVGDSNQLKSEDFNLGGRSEVSERNDGQLEAGMSLEEAEKILIEKTLEQNEGNITQSAEELGITRKTLRSKKEKYGLD